jgi:hypothetical protein
MICDREAVTACDPIALGLRLCKPGSNRDISACWNDLELSSVKFGTVADGSSYHYVLKARRKTPSALRCFPSTTLD